MFPWGSNFHSTILEANHVSSIRSVEYNLGGVLELYGEFRYELQVSQRHGRDRLIP
jgi:hypothetical protein